MKVFSEVFLDNRVPLALIVLTSESNKLIRDLRNERGLDPKRLTTEDVKCVLKAMEELGYYLCRAPE